MKTVLTVFLVSLFMQCFAQDDDEVSFKPTNVVKYDVSVLSDKCVAKKISSHWQQQADALVFGTRGGGFFEGLFAATKTAAMATGSQGASALASVTFSTIVNAIKGRKEEWRKTVERESMYEKRIVMLENIDDFYSMVSDAGALDPSSMCFNGFSCFQQRGADTVFYVACHLDTSDYAIGRILKHSKFQLQLDSLVFNPLLCNLPNDNTRSFAERKKFSFEERSTLSFAIDIDITSSWINQAVQIYSDVKLGSFAIRVPITENSLDADGVFRFVLGKTDNKVDCSIEGDCFIVPRSYMGVRDEDGVYHDAWGTGQYKVTMVIKETCGVSDEFQKHWKADWKSRPKQKTLSHAIATGIKETLSKNSSTWVCSITEAPANYTKQQISKALGGGTQTTIKSNSKPTKQE
ncbi:MAG: hypothetical protein K6F33_13400 [Bacteroidales bacterium]|nr:hypothetical protein [Bacteroidales bacterium]